MRYVFLGIVWAWLSAVAATAATPNLQSWFGTADGCFIVYDVPNHRTLVRYNPALCAAQDSPCSTFKIPIEVAAFNEGLITERSTFKWDGTHHDILSWNTDQTVRSWLLNSVVWVSQQLTPRLGAQRLQHYLSDFHYGNQDMSGGITQFWLTSTLKISPDEQVKFLTGLWQGAYPISERRRRLSIACLPHFTSKQGWTLIGKTGTGYLTPAHDRQLGWFVAHLQRGPQEYVVVIHFRDGRVPTRSPAGPHARNVCEHILSTMGLW